MSSGTDSEALRLAEANDDLDVVILDMVLPGMDGLSAIGEFALWVGSGISRQAPKAAERYEAFVTALGRRLAQGPKLRQEIAEDIPPARDAE